MNPSRRFELGLEDIVLTSLENFEEEVVTPKADDPSNNLTDADELKASTRKEAEQQSARNLIVMVP